MNCEGMKVKQVWKKERVNEKKYKEKLRKTSWPNEIIKEKGTEKEA